MMDSLKYRERWESKKALYLKNGFNLYSPDNPKGRLIVTEDGSGRGWTPRASRRWPTACLPTKHRGAVGDLFKSKGR